MDANELQQLIELGESESLEFKKSLSEQADAIKTAVAFANGNGGWILFGVKPDGNVIGVTIGVNTLENLAEAFHQHTDPIIYPSISAVAVEGRTVIAVRVHAGTDKPYTYKGVAYKLVGRTTQQLSRSEYERMLLDRHTNGYETLPAIGARWEELDQKSLESFIAARAPRAWQSGADLVDRAITEKLAMRSAERVVPTIAGVLAFSAAPQSVNPAWGITALMFRGREFQREALLLRQDLTGSASSLIDAAAAFVARNMRTFPVFPYGETQRRDVREYDLAAVREAVANAVAHRDYSANEPIQIRLFDDRLEIQSPGPLPSELTIERILAGGVTRARNPILAQILLAHGYMERAGFGIVFIRQQMEKLGAPKPDFESGLAHFLVRLWARPNPNLKINNQSPTNNELPSTLQA
ncbi:MAG: putative DNA binding domain-containing protein [candidate division KSB1 bacterium]|nr:putative DNA binding domain-containing protein [candidate division KSB1 bacterium]MDZ7368936.1 putative DNA binding domain-containing protein [candidate division KSB1 bacterium]MDZ7406924.1 putative DNA binding domain-containing protein [candidate division KSB1 bacterium]